MLILKLILLFWGPSRIGLQTLTSEKKKKKKKKKKKNSF